MAYRWGEPVARAFLLPHWSGGSRVAPNATATYLRMTATNTVCNAGTGRKYTTQRGCEVSRGLGYWQQIIIKGLEASPYVPVSRLAVRVMGGSLLYEQYSALNRAAHSLKRRGVIGLIRVYDPDCRGQKNVRLLAIRNDFIAQLEAKGMSVDTVQNRTQSTLNGRALPGSYRTIARVTGCSKSMVWSSVKGRMA